MAQFLSLLEVRNRRWQFSVAGGSEIVTTWYCEPACAAPIVVCGLLGKTNSATYRIVPANDHEYPFMYCVEAHQVPMDPRSASSSQRMTPTITGNDIADVAKALSQPAMFDGPQSLDPLTNKFSLPDDKRGMCGAFIEAVYRPIRTIYNMPAGGRTDEDYINQFDYLDPMFHPCSRAIATGESGFLLADGLVGLVAAKVPTSSGNAQTTETWQEFTIRRAMCHKVPWLTIQSLTDRINGTNVWKPKNMTIPGLKDNTFSKGTLRFDGADPVPKIMPQCDDPPQIEDGVPVTASLVWWDISYKFSYRTTWAVWTDHNQVPQGPEFISWNCDWFNGITGWLGGAILLPGWYEQTYQQATNAISLLDTRPKYLDAEDITLPITTPAGLYPFDTLFLNDSP